MFTPIIMEKKSISFTRPSFARSQRLSLSSLLAVLTLLYLCYSRSTILESLLSNTQDKPNFQYLADHCSSLGPISPVEYHERQTKLATTLQSLNALAYIAEPGPNAEYFANLSLSQWRLSERPFLLMISPMKVVDLDMEVGTQVTIITPLFEESRARLLDLPTAGNIRFIPWAEDADPYAIAIASLTNIKDETPTVYIDEGSRFFIADGISKAAQGTHVQVAPAEIHALRERKSPAEIALLRCANEVTLLALRGVQKMLHIGITESEAKGLILQALSEAGLQYPQATVLFGENAALPHGGGNDRELGEEDLALFDITGSLHGYWSDLTRTIAIPKSKIHTRRLETWYLVLTAQSEGLRAVRDGATASEVDEAARSVIENAGAGKYFTHRLGHGTGIQLHEAPYIRGGNNVVLSPGNVFSNEPGIYIEGEVGIRLEDCVVVADTGKAVLLTAGVGGQAFSPWEP